MAGLGWVGGGEAASAEATLLRSRDGEDSALAEGRGRRLADDVTDEEED